ncbi:MAG: WecB/TagA/CpsF family glycosyltransferase [Spartobacteria bacterium]
MPLLWCLNARGAGLRDRVYGPTFMRRCLEASPAPDFIWVGLGRPKQQDWIHRHKSAIQRGVLFAVGLAFDVNSGLKKDAPDWMQRVRAGPTFHPLSSLQLPFPLLSGERCAHFSSCLTHCAPASRSSSRFASSNPRPPPRPRRARLPKA